METVSCQLQDMHRENKALKTQLNKLEEDIKRSRHAAIVEVKGTISLFLEIFKRIS